MKKTIAISVSVLALLVAAQANAADVYSAPGGYAATNWGGLYLGAHIGGAWSGLKSTDVDYWYRPNGYSFTNSAAGVFGGGQAGYNLQRGNYVFGLEADFGDLGLTHKQFEAGNPLYSKVDSGFYADVTGRLGYALDRALIYAKGGYAYYGGSIGIYDPSWSSSISKSGLSGWTVGGGVEYKLSPAWSLKAEYMHFDFGSQPLVLYVASDPAWSRYPSALAVDSVKMGVNYFVNSGYEPLK